MTAKKVWTGRLYLGQDADGKQRYRWIGRFPTRRERDLAVAKARLEVRKHKVEMTAGEWVDRWLRRYEKTHKQSSVDTARSNLGHFKKGLGHRPLSEITRIEAMDWAEKTKDYRLPMVVTLFNAAVDAELIDRNPFRGQARKGRGRADQAPPTQQEFNRLLEACGVHGWYAGQMRSLLTFAAYSGLRPGELFALEWSDIDTDEMRVWVRRNVYHGHVQTPKSGKARRVALTPPARDALLALDTREYGNLVFRSKNRVRLSQPTLSGYWNLVTAKAGLDFEWYLSTRHMCAHYLYVTLGLEPRVVAQQMGWGLGSTLKLLAVYGHGSIGALDEIDRAFAPRVVPLREAKGA